MYPNLQIIIEKAKTILREKYNVTDPDIDLNCFLQTFPDTACLFRKNASDFAGQAITKAYVTIVYELKNDIVLVFQKNNPVYGLHDYNFNAFWDDVDHKKVAPLYRIDKYN